MVQDWRSSIAIATIARTGTTAPGGRWNSGRAPSSRTSPGRGILSRRAKVAYGNEKSPDFIPRDDKLVDTLGKLTEPIARYAMGGIHDRWVERAKRGRPFVRMAICRDIQLLGSHCEATKGVQTDRDSEKPRGPTLRWANTKG